MGSLVTNRCRACRVGSCCARSHGWLIGAVVGWRVSVISDRLLEWCGDVVMAGSSGNTACDGDGYLREAPRRKGRR